ncbi:MAG: HesA/MoeB/ThiF family protein [Deltaproteobacteria bacterium]|jgi:molybdopterin/thiamine biosynthesis adenylyltransferase|nr:HesA/MoeB/ThiF family protein [Deltaproteobacteria bacterium]
MGNHDANQLKVFLNNHAEGDLISWPVQLEMMEAYNLSCVEAESFILKNNFLPARYQRNRQMFSIEDQQKFLSSSVAVIGCGGLGGYVIEELARIGVGQIIAVDPDIFVEHNLNRQLLASVERLGLPKVDAAVSRVAEVNPVVKVVPRQIALTRDNGHEVLSSVDLAIDAMDNVSGRLELAEVCAALDIPFIHGAIAGWYGQVSTILSGNDTLSKLYRSTSSNKGIETQLGNPSFTPAVIASLQVAEACKALLGKGELLRQKKLAIDLLNMEFEKISF